LHYHLKWKALSVACGIAWGKNFYLRCYPGTIRTYQVVEEVHHLNRVETQILRHCRPWKQTLREHLMLSHLA